MQCNQQPTHQTHRSTWITSVEHHKISQIQRTTTLCQSTTFYNASTIVQVIKIQNTISKDFTHLKNFIALLCKLLVSSCCPTFTLHVCFMRRARMWILIKHPEPSTLIVTLFHWHQCACQYKRSIICEKARVYNISISKHVKMECNQQPTHHTHRRTWITISRTSENLENNYILPVHNSLQSVNTCAKIPNKISKDFTHLKISQYYFADS